MPESRSNLAMEDFFRGCFSDEDVLEARIRVKTPALQTAVTKRNGLVKKLEHALTYEEVSGTALTHRSSLVARKQVDSIQTYAKELKEANDEVSSRIEGIEQMITHNLTQRDVEEQSAATNLPAVSLLCKGSMDEFKPVDTSYMSQSTAAGVTVAQPLYEKDNDMEISAITHDIDDVAQTDHTTAYDGGESNHGSIHLLAQGANLLSSKTKSVAQAIKTLVATEDGEYYSAGFVTFTSLRITNASLQMIHHDIPFSFEVQPAPRPEDSKLPLFLSSDDQSYSVIPNNPLLLVFMLSLLDKCREISQRPSGWNAIELCGHSNTMSSVDDSDDFHCIALFRRGFG